MLQQINLYRYLQKPSKIFLNFNVILFCYALYLIFLFFGSLFDISRNNKLEDQLAQASVNLAKETNELNRIKSIYPSVNLSDLEGSIRKLKDELKSKNEMFSQLSRKMVFSHYLIALGKDIIPSVWLTDIVINQFGKNITLKGQTTNPALLHTFVQNLHADPLFSTMNFHLDEITQTPENKKVAPFSSFTIIAVAKDMP